MTIAIYDLDISLYISNSISLSTLQTHHRH